MGVSCCRVHRSSGSGPGVRSEVNFDHIALPMLPITTMVRTVPSCSWESTRKPPRATRFVGSSAATTCWYVTVSCCRCVATDRHGSAVSTLAR